MRRSRPLLVTLLAVLLFATACGGDGEDAAAADESVTLRLGVFPNITHATGLVGIGEGIFAEHLGVNELEVSYFSAGPETIESLFAGAIDATFIGPNPAINAFAQSNGDAIRIVSGSTAGGAFLVTRPDITSVEQLEGTTLATPQLGNTQDVALRAWLHDNGFETDESGGGDVSIVPQANADTLTAFQAGEIDGAWVPEPWATRLIQEGGGAILVDERELWPEGEYVTTHLIVATQLLDEHPDVVQQLLEGVLDATAFVNDEPAEAQAAVNAQIEEATGKPIAGAVLAAAWEHLTFTVDPIASSLQRSASDAIELGLLDEVELDGIYALDLLNELLAAAGADEVEGL